MSQQADHSGERESMLRWQIADRGVRSERVLDAMRQVPRELFVPPGEIDEAYSDQALPIGNGQTISQPYIVALMTEALDLRAKHRVLEIGTGSGYHTAVLSRLAGRIYTIERIAGLMAQARTRLTSLGVWNVEYCVGDGTLGWEEQAPFDRIIIAAAAPDVPGKLLLAQLADGGIAVVPAGVADWQYLWKVTRKGGNLERENLGACRFVRLIGTEGWEE